MTKITEAQAAIAAERWDRDRVARLFSAATLKDDGRQSDVGKWQDNVAAALSASEDMAVLRRAAELLKERDQLRAEVEGLRRDAARLGWLDGQGYAYGFEDMHEGTRWEIAGPYVELRAAIDAAMTTEGGE